MDRYYEILGLQAGASIDEIRAAYRDLAKVWHPDRFAHDPKLQAKAQEKLKEINHAYEELCKDDKKTKPPGRSKESKEPRPTRTNESETPAGPGTSSPPVAIPTGEGSSKKRYVLYALVVILLVGAYLVFRKTRDTSPKTSVKAAANKPPLNAPTPLSTPASQPTIDISAGLVTPTPVEKVNDLLDDLIESLPTPSTSPQDRANLDNSDRNEATVTPGSGYFTIGSSQNDVLEIQGTPDRFSKDTFHYGSSAVYFRDDKVTGWENYYPRLKVKLTTSYSSSKSFIELGDSVNDVLAIQGTPDRFSSQTFHYGSSSIKFSDGKVVSWENYYPRLKVRLKPSYQSTNEYFTIGSTTDEVLAIQGTPDRFSKDTFHYGSSTVRFVNGRVASWENYYPRLRVKLESTR
jgi:hypothetical protein